VFTHPALTRIEHRPFPMPPEPWRWRQTWHNLLFMHWPVPVSVLRPHIPAPVSIDEREGSAWLGLVPFTMSAVTMKGVPSLPWLSAFPEMNLRTYVTFGGKPGVWFLRMDCTRLPAVLAARWGLGLPYVWSRMRVRENQMPIEYESGSGTIQLRAAYEPCAEVRESESGSLEEFLTERYCLYTVRARRLLRVTIHHWPWPLQVAAATVTTNTVPAALQLPQPKGVPLLHFAKRIDVIGWAPEFCGRVQDS
jgi:uncharacterized protein YqjF (DUF2071 family)